MKQYRAVLFGMAGACLCSGQTLDRAKLEAETKMLAQMKVASITSATMGNVVKNAPYSAVEIAETNQTLGDGTRIRNESQVKVFRDSQGRVRRETDKGVTIWDPVAQASYVLDTSKLTARKLGYSTASFTTVGDGNVRFNFAQAGEMTTLRDKIQVDDAVGVMVTKMRAEAGTQAAGAEPPTYVFNTTRMKTEGTEESLGKQVMEGVSAEGKRSKSVIAAGAIGNDRPIETVNERWYSADLSIAVMTRHSDPRSGEETFRVTNIVRGEPSPDFFVVPSGYQILDRK